MRDSLTMHERLGLETKIHHGPAASARVALLGKPTRERYADYLARIYVFEAPAEARWIRTPGLEATLDVSSRVFAPVLEKDLALLGRFPDVYETGGFKTIAQALGWMYVVARGRLMHALLHRHLARRLPFESSIAGTYMAGSSSLGLRWQQLAEALDGISKRPLMVTHEINGALEAFRELRHPTPHNTPQQHAA